MPVADGARSGGREGKFALIATAKGTLPQRLRWRPELHEEERADETTIASNRGDRRAFRLRDYAPADDDLLRWLAGCGWRALPASSSTAATPAAAADGMSGRNDGPGRNGVPTAAASAAVTAASGPRGRARLSR